MAHVQGKGVLVGRVMKIDTDGGETSLHLYTPDECELISSEQKCLAVDDVGLDLSVFPPTVLSSIIEKIGNFFSHSSAHSFGSSIGSGSLHLPSTVRYSELGSIIYYQLQRRLLASLSNFLSLSPSVASMMSKSSSLVSILGLLSLTSSKRVVSPLDPVLLPYPSLLFNLAPSSKELKEQTVKDLVRQLPSSLLLVNDSQSKARNVLVLNPENCKEEINAQDSSRTLPLFSFFVCCYFAFLLPL
jgi:hypothetical protein